jgi:hypothetical protein
LAVSSAFLSFSVAAILAQGPQAASALKVAVLAGDGRVHNLRQPVPAEVVVEVRDSNANPLKEAIVVFQLPASGPSGLFADDSLFASVVTDEQGRAVVRGLKPNSVVGRWEIAVTVSYQGASSNAWIAQMNEEAAARPVVRKTGRGGSGKIVAIVVLVAAAAGGGIAAAALSGKKNTTTSTSPGPTVPATTGATISITTITVGAPP